MILSKLATLIPGSKLQPPTDVEIDRVEYDSRRCSRGVLFVAIPGQKTDGHRFLAQAFEAGTEAAMVEYTTPALEGKSALIVPEARKAMAIAVGVIFS